MKSECNVLPISYFVSIASSPQNDVNAFPMHGCKSQVLYREENGDKPLLEQEGLDSLLPEIKKYLE